MLDVLQTGGIIPCDVSYNVSAEEQAAWRLKRSRTEQRDSALARSFYLLCAILARDMNNKPHACYSVSRLLLWRAAVAARISENAGSILAFSCVRPVFAITYAHCLSFAASSRLSSHCCTFSLSLLPFGTCGTDFACTAAISHADLLLLRTRSW